MFLIFSLTQQIVTNVPIKFFCSQLHWNWCYTLHTKKFFGDIWDLRQERRTLNAQLYSWSRVVSLIQQTVEGRSLKKNERNKDIVTCKCRNKNTEFESARYCLLYCVRTCRYQATWFPSIIAFRFLLKL